MGRAPCCEKNGLKRGPWTPEEDQRLIDYIQKHGHGSWRTLPKNAGLSRCGKSCRLRWTNYLRPDIKRGRFSFEEEETIIQLHSILGNKWSAIAARLPGRTDNEIKNYWNTHIRKRLLRMGIDPVTHSPRLDLLDLSTLLTNPSLYNLQAQFEVSRLLNFEPLQVNSDLLRFASNLLSSQNQSLQQEPAQFTNTGTSTQVQDSIHHQQFQNHPVQQVPTCTTTTSEPHFFNVSDQLQTNAGHQWHNNNNMQSNFSSENFTAAATMGFDNLDEQLVPHFISDNSNFYLQNNGHNFAMNTTNSGISTPVSSPTQLNSASTYINCSTEDERDSYCSELFKFEIPELLDVSEYM